MEGDDWTWGNLEGGNLVGEVEGDDWTWGNLEGDDWIWGNLEEEVEGDEKIEEIGEIEERKDHE